MYGYRAAREAAMPEVQKLVKRFGLTAVGSCIGKLREKAKAQAKFERAAAELEAMKRNLEG